jgi:RNA polymerase sigma factor (sigma-70 family)
VETGSDEGLWVASLHGDGVTFGELFDRHHPRVYQHAVRLLSIGADAEDVTAAAFLELWRRRSDVRIVNHSILAWLLVTTSNLARNAERGTRRYRQFLERLPRQVDSPDTADLLMASMLDAAGQLSVALRSLGQQDLQLITLVVLEDFTITEAALAVGLSATATRTRLHRARVRLRLSLASHPYALSHLAPSGDRS